MDDQGNALSLATATVGLLLGDANGDRVVNPADRHLVKSLKGQKIDSTNFRSDVNSDGYIGSADVRLVEQQQGISLP
jgi:Dockerin type I domain